MKQRLWSAAALVLIVLLLCGCQGKPLPTGMEEEELLKHGLEAVLLLAGGNYDEIHNLMREDVSAGISVEDIQSLVIGQTDGAGTYKQIGSSMVTGQSFDGEEYGVAVYYCEYSKKNVLYRLAFDTNYELIGMQIKKQ